MMSEPQISRIIAVGICLAVSITAWLINRNVSAKRYLSLNYIAVLTSFLTMIAGLVLAAIYGTLFMVNI